MEFAEFVKYILYGLLGGCCLQAVQALTNMGKSIETLNNHMVVMIEKTTWFEKMLDQHSKEIEDLKSKSKYE